MSYIKERNHIKTCEHVLRTDLPYNVKKEFATMETYNLPIKTLKLTLICWLLSKCDYINLFQCLLLNVLKLMITLHVKDKIYLKCTVM